jgi:lysophospholipase L1-like esterase
MLLLVSCERRPQQPEAPAPSEASEVEPPQAESTEPEPEPAGISNVRAPVELEAATRAHADIQRRQLGEPLEPSELVHFTPIEDVAALAAFYEALRRLEAGESRRLRIAVYGSSNIAGDRFTGYLRGYLQARFGNGGPGFVALVPLWRWHRHQEITLDVSRGWTVDHALRPEPPRDGRYGLMGVRASTRAPGARIELKLRGLSETIEHAEIWFDGGEGHGSFELRLQGGAPTRVETDAPGPGYVTVDAPTGASELELRVDRGLVRLFGAVLEREGPGVVVDELGIGGSGVRRWQQWDEALWAEQLARREPALVILAYGGIESMRKEHDPARFEAELGDALTRVTAAAPRADCLLIGPQDRAHRGEDGERRRPASLDGIIAIERRLAAAHGCAFFDTQAMMGGAEAMPRWVEAELARDDHVHFSPRGYAYMGRVFADALLGPYDIATAEQTRSQARD